MPTPKTINELTDRYGAKYPLTCGLSHYFPVMNGSSKVFWVEGSIGDDDAPGCGQTPDAPLDTITKALSYCSDDIPNDYIFVANCTDNDTYPIQISKAFVHIIGAWGLNSPTWIDGDTGDQDEAAIEFVAGGANCELAYLEFGAGDAKAGIEAASGTLWANYIHHCRFGMSLGMGAKYGIEVIAGTETINWIIEDCRFGYLLTSGGIIVPNTVGTNGVKGTIIRNNHFSVVASAKGINIADVSGDFKDGGIFNNTFQLDEDADGSAIYFADGAKGSIHGNAAYTDLSVYPTNAPFFDAGASGTPTISLGANVVGGGLTGATPYEETLTYGS